MTTFKTIKLGAVAGRHEIPEVEGYVLNLVEDPSDLEEIERNVFASLDNKLVNVNKLDLYVTGLTSVVLATVKYCSQNNVKLSCWHFNREDASYFKQKMF